MKKIISYIVLALWIPLVMFIDYLTPLGVADGILYIPGLVFSAVLGEKPVIIGYALLCTLATISGIFFSPDEGVSVYIYGINRIYAIAVIWLIALFNIIRLIQKDKIEKLGRMIIMSAWNKQVKYKDEWISVEDYMRRELGISVSHSIDPESAAKMLKDLDIPEK
jgi:hypothetical protein